MKGHFIQQRIQDLEIEVTPKKTPEERLRELILSRFFPDENIDLEFKNIQLFYIRDVSGVSDEGEAVSFTPQFVYAIDIGYPRLVLVSLPYQVPTNARGDAKFPDFDQTEVYSGANLEEDSILFPAVPGELIIGLKSDVSEDEARQALADYVLSLERFSSIGNFFYVSAKVSPFRESEIAAKIESEVDIVRYAELNNIGRIGVPWLVDRVL